MSIELTIEQFYAYVKQASQLLATHKNEIDTRQEKMKACIASLTMDKLPDFEGDSKLNDLCQKQIQQYQKSIAVWKSHVEKYVSGKEFVNQFEKSFLLIVFADVKAGKSTLGNFISGYAFRGTPYEHLYSKPTCYAYDYTDKSLDCGKETMLPEGCFKEDEIQATASIQYFTLYKGLTWVDTPGIHSLTTEYEELAKEYVKFADLILFLTPSNNPIKQDEAYEIRKLIQCDKPLLITITKSDLTTKKVINGKLCTVLEAKTSEGRKQQEEYTETEIKKMGKNSMFSQNRYISISTRLAKKALEDQNEQKFIESNMPSFFEQIGSIISEKAIELKMKRPKDALNTVVDELLQGNEKEDFIGVIQLEQNIQAVIADITRQCEKMHHLKSIILENAKAEIRNRMYTVLYQGKSSGMLLQKEVIGEKMGTLISEVLNQEISKIIGMEISNFQETHIANAHVVIDVDYKKKTQTIQYEMQEGRERKRSPKGFIEHVQSWFGKEFTEFSVKTITKTREIEIGDNFNEYVESVWNDSLLSIEAIIDVEMQRIQDTYFGVLQNAMLEIKSTIESVHQRFLQLKY